ncbi:lactate utilization protein [Peptacetobacter hominis]|uniref:Lactate utilization protein n=1 Tax=Peptacetobacter hominis TaxID=2743610 RepID=A0A544QVK7_9FIRM|nr:lactate utilization protein [Peptacetobacter hominis]TQQ84727.1 lactate utilization protein [Peptacetobacter hominis]
MDNNMKWLNEKKIEKTIRALENNNINGYFAKDKDELISTIKSIVKSGSTVSCGGSMTLFETDIIDFLRGSDYNFLDRYKEGLSANDIKEIYRKSFFADAYFTSSNAITENGELYNVDGNGNRVAAMIYGPDKVIVISGVNKIVKNEQEAIERVRNIAAPANAKRLNTDTPCSISGSCAYCSSSDRICCDYVTIKKQRSKGRMHVIFLNEVLGY